MTKSQSVNLCNLRTTLEEFIAPVVPFLAYRLGISKSQTQILTFELVAVFLFQLGHKGAPAIFDKQGKLDPNHKKQNQNHYQKFSQSIVDYNILDEIPSFSLSDFFAVSHINNHTARIIRYLQLKHHLSDSTIRYALQVILALCQYGFLSVVYHLNLSKNECTQYIGMQKNAEGFLSDELIRLLTQTKSSLHTTNNLDTTTLDTARFCSDTPLPMLIVGRALTPPTAPKTWRIIAWIFGICMVFAMVCIGFCCAQNSQQTSPKSTPTPPKITPQKPIIPDVAIIRMPEDDATDEDADTDELLP